MLMPCRGQAACMFCLLYGAIPAIVHLLGDQDYDYDLKNRMNVTMMI